MPVYLAYLGITLLHNTKELFKTPWFPFICQPDPGKESELSSHKSKISVIFPTCHALPYKKSLFPFLWVLLPQLMFVLPPLMFSWTFLTIPGLLASLCLQQISGLPVLS